MSLLDFIVNCATADPSFVVDEIRPDVWEASCCGRRFRAATARHALERLAGAYGFVLYEDAGEIAALCEGLAPSLCSA